MIKKVASADEWILLFGVFRSTGIIDQRKAKYNLFLRVLCASVVQLKIQKRSYHGAQ
jgi:hypothetical protein